MTVPGKRLPQDNTRCTVKQAVVNCHTVIQQLPVQLNAHLGAH